MQDKNIDDGSDGFSMKPVLSDDPDEVIVEAESAGYVYNLNVGSNREDNATVDAKALEPKTIQIKIDNLVPFAKHPFEPYEGQRFIDMVESIKANGVIVPIIVRSISKDKYEILSGHNRARAAKEAGYTSVPAVVRDDLSDEEALLIVTETNLIQRSFADLKHSERAIALATHYEAMKKKSGYRSDLLDEIETLTSAPVGRRPETRDKLGSQYGLGKTTVTRYLRINKLIPALKNRLDSEDIGMRVAEALSFLQVKDQKAVEGLLAKGKKISIKQADELKATSEKDELNKDYIKRVFEPGYYESKIKPLKLSGRFLSQHFNPKQSIEEIEEVIAKALEMYCSQQEQ